MTDNRAQIAALLAEVLELISESRVSAVPEPRVTPQGRRYLFTVEEAAAQLGIGRTLAWHYVKTEALVSVKVGRLRRVHADAVADFAAQLAVAPTKSDVA
jgi:excisionase family DNA binding protein